MLQDHSSRPTLHYTISSVQAAQMNPLTLTKHDKGLSTSPILRSRKHDSKTLNSKPRRKLKYKDVVTEAKRQNTGHSGTIGMPTQTQKAFHKIGRGKRSGRQILMPRCGLHRRWTLATSPTPLGSSFRGEGEGKVLIYLRRSFHPVLSAFLGRKYT